MLTTKSDNFGNCTECGGGEEGSILHMPNCPIEGPNPRIFCKDSVGTQGFLGCIHRDDLRWRWMWTDFFLRPRWPYSKPPSSLFAKRLDNSTEMPKKDVDFTSAF